MSWIPLIIALAALYIVSPFMLWRSFFLVVRSVLGSRDLALPGKLRLLAHLGKEFVYAPLLAVLWLVDEALWRVYRRTEVNDPVFIMSQPRSGTTFLLRTLAADQRSFFVLKHLDWRFPFIGLWKLIDRLGLRERLERIDYWPDTELGRLASKLHFHNLGSVEGHGVFFEERMYHHYFTFRRFPLPEVLRRVGDISRLSAGEKQKLVGTLRKAVRKAAFYRGANRYWITKENENVNLFRLVYEAFPKARFLVIVRDPGAFVSSYIKTSDSCTTAKHGIDPKRVADWHTANLDFRREQCRQHIAFCRELELRDAVTYVSFEEFTTDIVGTVNDVYERMGIAMSDEYADYLRGLQVKQNARVSGYTNPRCEAAGFEDYSHFVARVGPRPQSALRA